MFCEKCGTAIEENAAFCHECGVLLQEDEKKDVKKKKKAGWIIVLSVAGGVVALVLVIGIILFVNYNRYIDLVKNSCPELYPDTTYNEVFTNYFSKSKWQYFLSDDGEDVVEFRGQCLSVDSDKIFKMKIQFLADADNENVTFHTLVLDGKEQSEFVAGLVMMAIFESYEHGESDGKLDVPEEEEESDISEDNSGSEEEDVQDADNDDTAGYSDDDSDDYSDDYSDDDTDGYSDDYSDDDSENYDDYYIFEDSSTRLLKNSELEDCDAEVLRLGRNEIYARHGRRFLDEEIQSYFDSMPWYEGTIEPEDFKESVLNKYEKRNLQKIKLYESRQ